MYTTYQYRDLIESMQDCSVVRLDTTGVIAEWSPGAYRLTGYSEEEITGKPFAILFPLDEQHRGVPEKLLTEATRVGGAEFEGWHVRKNNETYWAKVIIAQDPDAGYLMLERDLTYMRQSEARFRVMELEKIRRMLEQKVKVRTEELETMNEEITASNEQLVERNEELVALNEKLVKAAQIIQEQSDIILKQKEERLNRVLDSSHDVIFSFDLTGEGTNYLSRSAVNVYDEEYEQLVNEPYFWLKYVHPDDREIKNESQRRLEETGETECAYRIVTRKGIRWIRDSLKLIRDTRGKKLRIDGIASDITNVKEAERQMEDYRKNLEIVFQNTTDVFALLDIRGRVILYNKKFEEYAAGMARVSPKIGMKYIDVVSPNRRAAALKIMESALLGERISTLSETIWPWDTRYYQVTYSPVISDGIVTHVTVTSTDVTDKKKQDDIVKEYRENLEIIFQNSTNTFILLNTHFQAVLYNKVYENYVKDVVGGEPYLGMSFIDTVSENRRHLVREILEKVRQGQTYSTIAESVWPNGTKYFDVLYSPVVTNGIVTHITVTSADITEKKKQENILQEYRESLETVFNNSSDVFFLLDRNSNLVLFNRLLREFSERSTGITPKVGMNYYDIVAPDRIEQNRELLSRAFAGEMFDAVNTVNTPNGPIYFNARYNPVFENGEVTHVVVSALDITEKKNQELKLLAYQQNLDIVFKTTKDTLLLLDANARVVLFNYAFETFIKDVANIQPQAGMSFLDVVAPYRRRDAAALFERALSGESFSVDAEFKSSKAENIFHFIRYQPIEKDGAVAFVCVSGVDVTEFQKIENELKRDQFFLEKASESAKMGYWTSEPGENGKLTWSKEVFKIFRVDENNFDGTNKMFFDRVHSEDKPRVAELARQALKEDRAYNIDHRILLPDGSSRWVNERAQILRDREDEATLMVGVVQDINDRKVTEEALREYSERFEILSKATNDAIWDWNIAQDKTLWNHGINSIFGYSSDQIKPTHDWWMDKLHPEDRDRVNGEIAQAFEQKLSNCTCEYRYRCADGRFKYVLDRAYIVYTANQPVRMIGAMQDVSEITEYRINLEYVIEERTHKLNQALLKEKELVDLKSKFISIASHEFRTPLTTIRLASSFLKRYKQRLDPDQIEEKAHVIEKEIKHMTSLVDDVLFVGKMEDGKVKLNLKDYSPEVIEKLANEAMLSSDESHKLDFAIVNKNRTFKSDEKLLRNIIFNLVTNAVKFSPQAKRVVMRVKLTRHELIIVVRDEGIGIPSTELKNLFVSFSRATNASSIEGTGLGLLIVKKAVDLLGGTVEVWSELGRGTEFTVKLPQHE